MSESEKSFADRFGRAGQLKEACAGFAPAFAPADAQLTVAAFTVYLGQIAAKNTEVSDRDEGYSILAADRAAKVHDLKRRTTEAINYVESNSAWKVIAPKVKMPADKLRGIRPRPPKAPPASEGVPGKPRRNRGDQSYEDIAGHLAKFIAALNGVSGYAPPTTTLTIGAFSGLLSELKAMNSQVCTDEPMVSLAKAQRAGLYYNPGGLRDKMKAIKKAVRSQYGSNSAQYITAKAYKF